jgi:hypothetical protein
MKDAEGARDADVRPRAIYPGLPDAAESGEEAERRMSGWPLPLRMLSPPWFLFVTLAMSVCAWALPWSNNVHTGYSRKEDMTLLAASVLAAWYGWIVLAGVIGFELGRRFSPIRLFDEFPSRLYYHYFTVIGAIGVTYTYGAIVVRDPTLVIDAIRNRTFNDVRYAFGYGAGPQTLRYATILGGGIAVYETFFRSKMTKIGALNLFLLFMAAAAASRLSFLMAILIAVGLAVKERDRVRGLGYRILVLAIIGFVALTAFNYLRNANFYEAEYHTSNPVIMNLDEMIAYLGAPFQASVSAAKRAGGVTLPTLNDELVPNPGAESGTNDWETYDGGSPPSPTLARVKDPARVESGSWALLVRMSNPSSLPRNKYVWVAGQAAVPVAAGDRLLLRAFVSGPASRGSPIHLGVRLANGSVTEDGLSPRGGGLTLRRKAIRRLLEGDYITPRNTSTIQLAVWKERIPPHTAAQIAIDDASVVRRSTVPMEKPPLFRSLTSYLAPTYLQPNYKDVEDAENDYRRYVAIEATLTTNSAFAAMYGSLGTTWAFCVIGAICFLGSAFAGHASRYSSVFFLGVFILTYVFAELWRVYLFNYGIIQFLLVLLIVLPLIHTWLNDLWGRLGLRARLRRR